MYTDTLSFWQVRFEASQIQDYPKGSKGSVVEGGKQVLLLKQGGKENAWESKRCTNNDAGLATPFQRRVPVSLE